MPQQTGESYVQTAACLIIGDEVLNGKTKDSNSNFLAKMCFDLGIDLKRRVTRQTSQVEADLSLPSGSRS